MLPLLLGSVCFLLPRALAATRPLSPPGDVSAPLVFGLSARQMLRLRVEVPRLFLDSFQGTQKELLGAVERVLRASGWSDIRLVMQDPTEPKIFTVLARGRGTLKSDAFEVVGAIPVDEPGERSRPASRTTDPGLTEDETRALEDALIWDTNPKHLHGFAATFTPHFPVAHALLEAKARILESGWTKEESDQAFGPLLESSAVLRRGSAIQIMWRVLAEEATGSLPATSLAVNYPVARFLADEARAWAEKNRFPPELIAQECQRAIGLMVEGQDDALSAFPLPFLKCAAACLWPGDFVVPSGANIRTLFPPTGNEGFISPTALQLAESEMKPEAAGVARKVRVPAVLHDVASQADMGDPAAMRARAMVEKAEKAIDRKRWVDWYESEVGT